MTVLSENPDDFCFIDAETRSVVDGPEGELPEVGADVYADAGAFANIWTFAVGDDPVDIMALDDGFDERLTWEYDAPDRLKDFHERAMSGTAWYVAWNMGFDRAIWNGRESDFPEMRVDMSLDAMVQGTSAGLPSKLGAAGNAAGFGGKYEQGGSMMQLFAPATGIQPADRPDLWEEYKRYGLEDTELLRNVFNGTLPLPREVWEDYWVSERINGRGMALDVGFARRAAAIADANVERINAQLVRVTNGQITKVTQIARMVDWVYDRIDSAEARELMVKTWELDEEDDLQPAKLGLAKDRIEGLLAYFENKAELTQVDETIVEVLEHRLFGGSSSPAKFGKMVRMQHDGFLRGQYTFNGAPQTGRYSSRGVQIHNLIRKSLGDDEERFMEMVNNVELEHA